MCDTPFFVQHSNPALGEIPVPCGRCPPCKHRRVNSWVFRLVQEEKVSSSAYFVTLTYGIHSVPVSKNGFMTLAPKDMDLYFKRLRKLVKQRYRRCGIKYYYAGEYGSLNKRPHYHAIIFNVPDERDLSEAWCLRGIPIGQIHVGKVTQDSIAYTMKYIDKSTWKMAHQRDDRYPEFSRMSQGLGSSYLTPEIIRWHRADPDNNYCSLYQGHRIAMPRYYRKKIYTDDEIRAQLPHIQKRVYEIQIEDQKSHEARSNVPYEDILTQRIYNRYRSFYRKQQIKPRL